MTTATLSEIKRALQALTPTETADICLRLAKYRKENKELLTFLLFESHDTAGFVKQAKEVMSYQLSQASSNLYIAKKTIRKTLNTTNKFIKIAGSKQIEVELLLYFCQLLKRSSLPIFEHPVTENIYLRQITKIEKALTTLHEDLQHDYGEQLDRLNLKKNAANPARW